MGILKDIEVFDPNLTGEEAAEALNKSEAADRDGKFFKDIDVAQIKKGAEEWLAERKNIIFGQAETMSSEDIANDTAYTFDDDGFINTDRSVHLNNIDQIPAYIRFGTVGEFWSVMCYNMKNTDNFPNKVTGNMWIMDSGIQNITKFPAEIGGDLIIKNIPANSFGGIIDNGCEIHGSLYIGNESNNYEFDWEDKATLEVENRNRIKVHGALQVTVPKPVLADAVKNFKEAKADKNVNCPLRGVETDYKEGTIENDAFAYYINSLCSPLEFVDLDKDPHRILVDM